MEEILDIHKHKIKADDTVEICFIIDNAPKKHVGTVLSDDRTLRDNKTGCLYDLKDSRIIIIRKLNPSFHIGQRVTYTDTNGNKEYVNIIKYTSSRVKVKFNDDRESFVKESYLT